MPGRGSSGVCLPDTRCCLMSWLFESNAQTVCCDFEYTARRPDPEFAGMRNGSQGASVLGGEGGGTICFWVPRSGVTSRTSAGASSSVTRPPLGDLTIAGPETPPPAGADVVVVVASVVVAADVGVGDVVVSVPSDDPSDALAGVSPSGGGASTLVVVTSLLVTSVSVCAAAGDANTSSGTMAAVRSPNFTRTTDDTTVLRM